MRTDIHEEEALGKPLDAALLERLLGYAKPHWREFITAVGLVALSSATGLGLTYVVKEAIDGALSPAMALAPSARDPYLGQLLEWSGVFFVLLLATFVVNYVQAQLIQRTGQRIIRKIRQDLFDHLQSMSLAFFDRHPVGRLVTRVTNDTEALSEMYTSVLVNVFKDLFIIVGAAVIMLRVNPKLAGIVFLILPFVAITVVIFQKKARAAFRQVRTLLARINAHIAENLNGMRIVQIFAREPQQADEFLAINRAYFEASMSQLTLYAVFRPALDFLGTFSTALVLWYGGAQVLGEQLPLGVLYLFTSYVRKMFDPINELAEKFNILQAAMASSERIFQLLDTPAVIVDRPDAKQPPGILGGVSFEDLSFAYQDENWVLRGIDLFVAPGQTVAFVGHTGAGKSSILNLVARFYEPQRGRVLIDGTDVRELPQEFLRRHIGIVMQDVFMFTGTVLDNIRLGSGISEERAIEAARAVGANAFIERLPQGYHTAVAERGATLSQGERQLIAFARALAFDPAILILDEATAHVDSETESVIQTALQRLCAGRTTLVVAHRLSTIQHADRIVVLHKGEIREQGTHAELIAHGGLYRALWELQYAEHQPVGE